LICKMTRRAVINIEDHELRQVSDNFEHDNPFVRKWNGERTVISNRIRDQESKTTNTPFGHWSRIPRAPEPLVRRRTKSMRLTNDPCLLKSKYLNRVFRKKTVHLIIGGGPTLDVEGTDFQAVS
jgi:hypothetical protein